LFEVGFPAGHKAEQAEKGLARILYNKFVAWLPSLTKLASFKAQYSLAKVPVSVGFLRIHGFAKREMFVREFVSERFFIPES